MTIRKGSEWGGVGVVPAGLPVATSDAELFALLNRVEAPAAVGVTGGDLARTIGASGDLDRLTAGRDAVVVTVDVASAAHDHGTHRFVSHAIARNSWWRGAIVGVMNAQFVGSWDVAPKSHPNDGWLDVVEVGEAMSAMQRWQARRRLPTATHVPHPSITTRRVRDGAWSWPRPLRLRLDGVAVGRTRSLHVEVQPDAVQVWI